VAHADKKTTVAQTMMNVINEEEQHEWTPQNIKDLDKDLRKGPITSIVIKLEGDQSTNPSNPSASNPSASTANSPAVSDPYTPIAIPNPHTSQGGPRGGSVNNSQTSGTAKQISEVAKIITEEQKYDGTNGSFDHKYTIFIDICRRVALPEVALTRAFPTMLKGLALDQYYTNNLSGKTLEGSLQ
jgi:hypothetical protein